MLTHRIENTIDIRATATIVEHCITDRTLMHQWLNPALRCDPVGEWSVEIGAKSRFILKIPGLEPALTSEVIQREPGLIVWQFNGFFQGNDRWECLPIPDAQETMTRLLNRFEFKIPNPWVAYGFKTFAAHWTQQDMQGQLKRIQQLAERLSRLG